jgi:hypothetical protein
MALTPTPCRGTSYVPRQPQTRQAQVLLAGGARHRSRGSRGGRQGQLARSERVHRQRAGAQHAPRRRGRRTGARRTARVRKAAGGGDGRRAAVGRATAVGASAARAQAAGVRARDAARAQAATGEADDRGVSHGHREGGSFKWREGRRAGRRSGGGAGRGGGGRSGRRRRGRQRVLSPDRAPEGATAEQHRLPTTTGKHWRDCGGGRQDELHLTRARVRGEYEMWSAVSGRPSCTR